MNKIIKIELTLLTTGHWEVGVTKVFDTPDDTLIVKEDGGSGFHRALDVAREMVTWTPANVETAENRGWVRA